MYQFRKLLGNFLGKIGLKKTVLRIYDHLKDVESYVLYLFLKGKDTEFQKIHDAPKILTISETIDYISSKHCSVCRYGDGEFNIIENKGIGFQIASNDLGGRLKEIILEPSCDKMLVCIPGMLAYPDFYTKEVQLFWNKILVKKRAIWYALLNSDYQYGNADITRCYMGAANKTMACEYFNRLMTIWKDQNVLLVEGEKSRLGVGNDLFARTSSLERILCPAQNAFASYKKIYESTLKHAENKLILLAIGPTATILAWDLMKAGYWVIDIGNIDNEYEWYLAGATKKTRNPLKFSMEVRGGAITDDCLDEDYLHQIIDVID